jgi:YebC/PmpR family DNA-binding regulatory protein
MAGHSKWANIKHKKALQDKKKGKLFTKFLKEVTVAAQINPDPSINSRLKTAIYKAKRMSVPKENIEKALKKGLSKEGALQEIIYEAYGPEGVALYIECATDNLVRTVANIRSYLTKCGGMLAKDGSLKFLFQTQSLFQIKDTFNELQELELMDLGMEESSFEEGYTYISAPVESFGIIRDYLEKYNFVIEDAFLEKDPIQKKTLSSEAFLKFTKLQDLLEEDEDVQEVYHNALDSNET